MQQAEVVIYDRLVGDEILSQIHPQAEKIYVGKASRNHALQQEEINALLVEKAAQGKQVVRLKGGDPFVLDAVAKKLYICSSTDTLLKSCLASVRRWRYLPMQGFQLPIAVPAPVLQ